MATKLARMVIYLDRLLIIKSYKGLIRWSCKVTWQTKTIIFLLQVSLATKLGRMIAFLDRLLPIMSHDPLITWPCEIRGSLTGAGSARKPLSHHRLLVSIIFIRSIIAGKFAKKYLFNKTDVVFTDAVIQKKDCKKS